MVRKRKFGLNPSVLAKFDEKSGSALQKVVIFVDTKMKGKGKPPSIVQILERSKETLEEVFIEDSITSPARLEVFNELIYRLPRLVDCRLMNDLWEVSRVELMASGGNELTSEGNKNLSSLKVLWISVMEPTFSLHPEFLNNLSSLRLEGVMEEYLLRRLLDSASQTLKHLFITTASTHQHYYCINSSTNPRNCFALFPHSSSARDDTRFPFLSIVDLCSLQDPDNY